MTLSSTSPSHQQEVDTTTTTTSRGAPHSGASLTSTMPASMPGTITQANDRMYRHGRQLVSIGETPEVAHNVGQSGSLHLSGTLGPSNPPSALNRSGSQAIVQPPRPIRLMEKKFDALEKRCDQQQEQYNRLEKQYHAVVKHSKSQDRKIQRLEDRLKDHYQRCDSNQEDCANQISKILRDISTIREDMEQQISRVHKQSSEMRTDMGDIRSRMTENALLNGNPATSTHIVVGAESITRFLNSGVMHNNGGQQFGQKYKGHSHNRNNHQPHRRFHTPPGKFEGRHLPGPNRFRSEGVRGNNDGWHPSMPPPQNHPRGNGNKYNMDNSDRPPSDRSFQFNRSWEGQTADPSRQPSVGSQLPVKKRRWGPRLNDPNGIDVLPTAPNPDDAKVGDTHVADSVQSPESAGPLSMTITNQNIRVRSQSPSDFWEDDYEQRDEDRAPTGEASGSASAPGKGTITAVSGDAVERNPWASP
ncbi:hypothetical protein PILCRDRAFT_305146 [Piloderma croceum F 1598]|uniref:Uncharacterized protein n=1 Tax=Piloderma croceum (strain F 1598) TaxID=765440 RepID=A0A0C3G622_PILCF|nr:hypothetical protein PILCRDRAFT_305146 [Piloderma croceum F 1598]